MICVSVLRFAASGFNHCTQSAFAAGCCIFVDQVLGCGPVQFFAGQAELCLSGFGIASFGSGANLTNRVSHVRLDRFVANTEFFVLTKSFFG